MYACIMYDVSQLCIVLLHMNEEHFLTSLHAGIATCSIMRLRWRTWHAFVSLADAQGGCIQLVQQGVAVQELVQALEAILHTGSAISFQVMHACLFAACRTYGEMACDWRALQWLGQLSLH